VLGQGCKRTDKAPQRRQLQESPNAKAV